MSDEKKKPLEEGNTHVEREKREIVERPAIVEKKAKERGFLDKAQDFVEPIVDDVIIPSAQDTIINIVQSIFDGITNGIISAITGEESNVHTNIPLRSGKRRVDYNSVSKRRNRTYSRQKDDSTEIRDVTRLGDIRVASHADAVRVIERMRETIDKFDQVSMNDMYGYEEIDKSCPYSYTNFGWKNLDHAGIINYGSSGYGFDLPKPVSLN